MKTDIESPLRFSRLKVRTELIAVKIPRGHTWRWIIKDPISLHYFEFTHDEWFLLQQLDGHRSLEEIKECYNKEFSPQEIGSETLRQFFCEAYQSGIILVDGFGQGASLLQRKKEAQFKRFLYAPFSLLGMRLPLGDAQRLLNSLRLFGKVVFHPLFFALITAAMLLAAVFSIGRAHEIAALIPTMSNFFSSTNLWLIVAAWVVVKVLHELGHGLACRRFGGECHEFGTRCLYAICIL